MNDPIAKIDIFIVALAQDEPYLGSLRNNESINQNGYFVRQGNRTVYPRNNRSLVVRLRSESGVVGWGETYGLVAPKATAEIIRDLLTPFVLTRNPVDVERIHDELSDLMRVRGYVGGFYSDALAAIDIALWDVLGKQKQQSLAQLIGGQRMTSIPAYVSGLPRDTLLERTELAAQWAADGYDAFKFALPVADDGPLKEMAALRSRLGPSVKIACDLHWALSRQAAVSLDRELEPFCPWFLEAPLATEDIAGLAQVAHEAKGAIAVGEEWRTLFDAKLRIDREACQIIQPEMGHTGVTQFLRISRYAESKGLEIMPHSTIGSGIFLAASLQAASTFKNVRYHEFQHSIFRRFQSFTTGTMACESGDYMLPDGWGIGVEPSDEMQGHMTLYT